MINPRGRVIVFNPWAGRRKAHETLRLATTRLEGTVGAIVETSLGGSFAPRLREAVRHARGDSGARPVVVAVGGDGTLSMILNALHDPGDATLAVVPSGSGNDFATAIGCATVDAALEAIDRGATRDVDHGIVNETRFVNCVGIGLDAEVGALAAKLRKRGYPAASSYYGAALAGLFMVKPVGVSVEANGRRMRFERGVMVTVGNGHLYGGGFRGAPHARIDDGALDAYVFSDIAGFVPRLTLMRRIRAGTHVGQANVASIRAQKIVVEFDRDVAMHVDGEIAAVRRADVSVKAGGMRVIAPSA